jgi:hypothetical protein
VIYGSHTEKGISVRFSAIGMLRGLILGASTVALVACGGGGGGGSSGGLPGGPTPTNEYKVRITADRTALPLNLDEDLPIPDYIPSISSPYTTALYVQAFRERTNDPIPGGDDVFGCSVLPGIESGALYYFDGDDDHQEDVTVNINGVDVEFTVPLAYRAIVLGANAGGASFHFVSSDKAGTVTIRCSATDPLSGEQAFAEINLSIGGGPTGLPAQIRVSKVDQNDRSAGWLFPQGFNDPTMLRVQAELLDERGQAVTDPSSDNLRARIVGPVTTSAYLQSGAAVGTRNQYVSARSINGLAEFSINSGSSPEILLVEIETDRADNNVTNGVSARISNYVTVPVLFANPTGLPLSLSPVTIDFYKGESIGYALPISGGVAPYTCQIQVGNLFPSGLALSDCAIFGSILSATGTYVVEFVVRDSAVIQGMDIASGVLNVYDLPSITTTSLPDGVLGTNYNTTGAVVVATGGKAPLTFSATFRDAGGATVTQLSIDANTGALSGSVPNPVGPPTCPAAVKVNNVTANVTVTDANGRTAIRSFSIALACP